MKRSVALATVLVLCLAASGFAETASARLSLTVRPAVELRSLDATNVQLKIRLNRGAVGQVWTADTCTAAPADAQTVSRSGIHNVNVEGSGSRVCFVSTDGALSASLVISGR